MKLAYISTEYPPLVYGGLGVYVHYISHELNAMGQKISVFTCGDGKIGKYGNNEGIEVIRETPVPLMDGLEIFLSSQSLAWGSSLNFLLDPFSYNRLAAADILRKGPFDLCVAHDWLGLPGAMAVKREGHPMIYHVHGLEIGRSDRPNPQLVELERKGTELADLVITVSNAMKHGPAEMGVQLDKIRVCHHGVDAEFFDPERTIPERLQALRSKYSLNEDDFVVLFMGRLEPVKGVNQLIEAMSVVAGKYPKARLLIVGKGSLEENVKEVSEHRGFIILVTDFLSSEDKRDHYALADLCVFPSLYESFGIVALEVAAMSKVTVVDASGFSGMKEIVRHPGSDKPTGVHVNCQDTRDIAWGISLVPENSELRKAWGRNARQRVLENFTWVKAAEKTLAIYEEALLSRS